MAFPGGSGMGGMGMGMPGQGGMSQQQMQEAQMIKTMQGVMESCAGKSVMSGVMGFALGGMFGLFMSSMRYDTPMSQPLPGTLPAGVATVSDLPLRQQLKHGLKDMGKQSFSSAKNFGMIGAIFAGTECCIEGLRAKNDIWNGVWGGCLTGGALAYKAGPQAVLVGCGGFAAFSAAIEKYMRSEENEKRLNVI